MALNLKEDIIFKQQILPFYNESMASKLVLIVKVVLLLFSFVE